MKKILLSAIIATGLSVCTAQVPVTNEILVSSPSIDATDLSSAQFSSTLYQNTIKAMHLCLTQHSAKIACNTNIVYDENN